MAAAKESKFGKLSFKDRVYGLLVAVFTSLAAAIAQIFQTWIESESFTMIQFDKLFWMRCIKAAIAGAIGYMTTKSMSNSNNQLFKKEKPVTNGTTT